MHRRSVAALVLVFGALLMSGEAQAAIRTASDSRGGITIGSATRDRRPVAARPGPRYLSSVGRPVVRSLPILTTQLGYGGYGFGLPVAPPVFRTMPVVTTPASGVRVATFPQMVGPRTYSEIVTQRLGTSPSSRRGVVKAPENPMLQRSRDQAAQQRLLLSPR